MKKKRLLTDRTNGLEDQLVNQMANEMQREIDAEVLRSMFREIGWHEIVLMPMTQEKGESIDKWVQENIKGRSHWTHGLVWMFEEDRDAMWFKLTWLS